MNAHTAPIKALHRRIQGKDTETLRVNVIGCFTSPIGIQYVILEDGKIYHVNRHLLATLREGRESCKSLELFPVEGDDE